MALPTANTPGYTTFRGRVTCDCLARWLPVYERLLKARGLIKVSIDVWQLTGGATASGGTHSQGGAFDLLYQTSPAHVSVAREMGAPGTWARKVAQGFAKDHTHGVLSGCPHNGPAAYQITAQRRGYNGLGQATSGPYAGMWGYGGRDEFPDPQTYRTWQQGIAWAEQEIARLDRAAAALAEPKPTPIPTPAPPSEEDDMFSDADRAKLGAAKADAYAAHVHAKAASAKADGLAKALDVLADSLPEEIAARFREALTAAVIKVEVTVPEQTPPAPAA